jgi:hypothetical protein
VVLEDVGHVRADSRVQIERYVEAARPLPQNFEVGVVEVLANGMRIDEATAEAVLSHGALKLVGCHLRVLQRERREAAEARRVFVDYGLEEIVYLASVGDGDLSVPFRLNAGGRERQHLHVQALLVHLGNA